MIAEKPTWITHEGMQIFSVDIQPSGLRFATGGGDHKVRIWNSKSVNRDLDKSEANQRVLATLRDHFGSVNCVRWAKHGRLLASGSDDQVILVHERKPGSGTTEFGSGEPPDVENWKVALTLRGHVADVVDLNWSPDDSILASASLDNTIHIWDMSNGICTAVLRGHSSLVKGVAWDPIGSFIASQSDDKTVIIWRTSDWSLAHRIDGHWEKSLGSTFFRRLGWSPCGHFITTTHGFQKPRHSAPVLERGEWAATFDFLGHNAPIIVVKFNHSMFRSSSLSQESKSASAGWANGNAKIGGKETQPYNVIAIGSQDRTITVWTTASPRPLFVAKHFFTQSVVDLSWSPDGFSLFACSLDGTVATFHFDQNELGVKLTDSELEELKRSRYGDVRGRQTNLAESPAQLLLEEASAKQSVSKKPLPPKVPVEPKSINPRGEEGKKGETLVKQREYRRPDGRKRIIPEALGVPSSGNAFPAAEVSEENKTDSGIVKATTVTKPLVATAKATIVESLTVEKVANSKEREPTIVSPQTNLLITVIDKKLGDDAVPVCLEARPRQQAANDGIGVSCENPKESEIVCLSGNQTLWSDRVWGKVTALTGNANFWAVGCDDGSLQVYTKCGRRAMPGMMIGSPATFVDCDEEWQLLVVTRKGGLYVWDLFNKRCVLQNSLGSLVASEAKGIIKVISAKLSKCGSPLVVLATRNAFLFDLNLGCWLRVADDCFPASNFASSWNLGFLQTGELANLQVEMRKFMARKPGWTRVTDDGAQTRGHLEAQLASALALKSANEYRQCLLSYVRFLAREADESRLREVCESFLGPPGGIVESCDSSAWESTVLGMRKHKLLRDDILPAMASNRKVQRLLNEFMDLLSEYEEQTAAKPSTCPMECDPRPSDGVDSEHCDTQPASEKPSSCPDDASQIVPDTPMVG